MNAVMPPDTDVDSEELMAMLAAEKRQVRDRLEHLGVTRDLGPQSRDRLTDIVEQFSGAYGLWQRYRQAEKRIRIDQRFGSVQRTMFKRKVKNALAAVDAALKYVSQVSGGARRNEIFAQTLRGLATPYLQDAKTALQTIPLRFGNFTRSASVSGFQGFPNPKRKARAVLMAFFVDTCAHTKSQASQRTARIGNAFFDWDIDEYDHHESANRKRSRAVLKSLSRQQAAKRR